MVPPRKQTQRVNVVDHPYEGSRLARAILDERVRDVDAASGICIGLPALRAGKCVVIEGTGKAFGGSYLVTHSTHTIDEQGYETSFGARREQNGDLVLPP
jgi:phage protein D